MKPVIAVDIDGVLLPFNRPIEFNPQHGEWLNKLSALGELVWATSWEYQANTEAAPALGLPQLPVIELNRIDKTNAVSDWVGDRPLVWIDDVFANNPGTIEWARERHTHTLLIGPDPHVGLIRDDMVKAWKFLRHVENRPWNLM